MSISSSLNIPHIPPQAQNIFLQMLEWNSLPILVGLVTKLCPTLVTSWTVAHQAPLSMGFSKQEYWSGLPFPSPGGLPDPGIEPGSPPLQAVSFIGGGFFTN